MADKKLKNIIYTAAFAAVICAATIIIRVPAAGGYYHIGDAFIYLAGALLGFPYALAAGAAGGALADLFSGYAVYIIPTFIIKACVAACFSNKTARVLCVRNLIAVAASSVITVGGYFAAYVIFYGFAGALVNLYGDLGQAAASAAVFAAAGAAADKIKLKIKN